MTAPHLQEIEAQISILPEEEQRWLLGRLSVGLVAKERAHWETSLATMAADPDIQRELRLIEEEFAVTEGDGLENA